MGTVETALGIDAQAAQRRPMRGEERFQVEILTSRSSRSCRLVAGAEAVKSMRWRGRHMKGLNGEGGAAALDAWLGW
jgi:hypothetical protein